MSRKEGPRQAFVLMKTCWRRLEDVFSVASFHLSRRLIDILDYEKLLRIIITKTENRFVILLDFGYVKLYVLEGKKYLNTFSRRHQDMTCKRLQDMSLRRLPDVLETKKYFLGLFVSTGVAGLQSRFQHFQK